jgi:hypothetical protein
MMDANLVKRLAFNHPFILIRQIPMSERSSLHL